MVETNDLFLEFSGPQGGPWQARLRGGVWESLAGVDAELLQRVRWLAQRPLAGMPEPGLQVDAEWRSLDPDRQAAWLGSTLGKALGPAVLRDLRLYEAVPHLRLFLDFSAAPELADLPWESMCLDAGCPVLTDRWQVIRHRTLAEAQAHVGGTLRVLILVGEVDQRPEADAAEPQVAEEVRAIRATLQDLGFEVQVAVARPQLRTFLGVQGLGEQVKVLRDAQEFLGYLARHEFHVLHLIGHSNHEDAFWWAASTVNAEALGKALAGKPTRLLVFNQCLSSKVLAHPLSSQVDHVVAMQALVPPALGPIWCGRFYGALREHLSVGEAARRAREAIRHATDPLLRTLDWVVAHWSRVQKDQPFADRATLLLERYRAAVAASHRDLLGAFYRKKPRAGPPPEPVGLRLRILTEEADGHGQRRELHAEPLTIHALLSRPERRWIVRGGAGGGKTTTLRCLARQLAQDTARHFTPIYVRLRHWAKDAGARQDPTAPGLLRYAVRQAGHSEDTEALVQELDRLGRAEDRLVVLLDGLDEVKSEDPQASDARTAFMDVSTLAGNLVQRWPGCRLLCSSRPFQFQAPEQIEFALAEIEPLRENEQEDLLTRWLIGPMTESAARDLARGTCASLRSRPTLRELAESPLCLSWMAMQVEETGRPLPLTRGEFYERLFRFLLQGRHRPPGERDPIAAESEALLALAVVAHEMTAQLRIELPLTEIEGFLRARAPEEVRALFGAQGLWLTPGIFLQKVAERTDVLAPDGPDGPWTFPHRGLQEALTARALHAQYVKDQAQVHSLAREIVRKARAREGDALRVWGEPFALLSGHLPEPDAWILALARDAETRELGLRAVAAAETARPETLQQVLEGFPERDQWQERRIVFEGLGDRFGQGPKVLDLLEAQGRRHWNGNDLYFIDEALRRCERHGPLARQVRERLFSVRTPDLALFREVPGHAGETLWPMLPAGEFEMGGPEEAIPVNLTRPFWISAVTITARMYREFDPVSVRRDNDLPAMEISFEEAIAFARWLGFHVTGCRDADAGNVPTEEQWEYAARAWPRNAEHCRCEFWSGNAKESLPDVGWFDFNTLRPHPVAELRANPSGLYDVHGNVWEWCRTVFRGGRSERPYVRRGGSFHWDEHFCTAAFRFWNIPVPWDPVGFRVVLAGAPVFSNE